MNIVKIFYYRHFASNWWTLIKNKNIWIPWHVNCRICVYLNEKQTKSSNTFQYKFNSFERLEKALKRLTAFKKSTVPKKLIVFKSNKRITKIKTSQKEKKKIRSIKKDEENNNDDDETYEIDEAYETDEDNKYYNKITNINESEEE
ncbi:hypothetical protein Glove_743g7 [Diversispora epigaea]|uniref:Uncharacterized protein n=1 Tax=Diversispora epigaea TaxID=1348612 RepID=A0A397G350_9GLOM|nr:hypothetical protein Glove_743g7 [Diversispora epigaea]